MSWALILRLRVTDRQGDDAPRTWQHSLRLLTLVRVPLDIVHLSVPRSVQPDSQFRPGFGRLRAGEAAFVEAKLFCPLFDGLLHPKKGN